MFILHSSTVTAVFMDPIMSLDFKPFLLFPTIKKASKNQPTAVRGDQTGNLTFVIICFMKKHHYQTRLFCMDKG